MNSTAKLENLVKLKFSASSFAFSAIGKFQLKNLNVGSMIFIPYRKHGRKKMTKSSVETKSLFLQINQILRLLSCDFCFSLLNQRASVNILQQWYYRMQES